MNSELINALISQIGNIVGIPLAAVLAVWQVKKGFISKRNDEVNEKSFGLCCELFDLVSRNESYNKEVTDKITTLIGSAALVGLVIEIWRFWKNKSPNSFWRFVKEQKRKIKEEEKENT